MLNKKFITLGFITTATAISLFFSPSLFAATPPKVISKPVTEASRLEALAKFTKVLSIVEQYNVDDVTLQELIDKALQGMMTNLDAHSAFMNKKSFESLKVQTDGEFGGLGITVGMKDGALTVIAPLEGTPADKAGLKAEDIILKINDKSTLSMTIDDAVSVMRGEIGTPIDITVVRKSEIKPLHFHIIRGKIDIQSVYTKQIDDSILYIRITSFDKKVVEGVKKAINQYKNKDKGIILDLRNNPGGLLDQAVGLVDLFVDKGIIVSQKGRTKTEDKEYDATTAATMTKMPMVVLINGGSASASEIVSGALQDQKRAVLVGTKSFGKGSVQVVLPISEDEAIKLTIARYYLPSGRTIQAVGVTPDIEVNEGVIKTDDNNDFMIKEADLKQHLEKELQKDTGKADKTKEKEKDDKVITKEQMFKDLQLKEAFGIIKALIITKG
ncbi:MAG: S41 family peptidase [Thiovulaceae bacterium]|nr:S41 family peptidase [Sulfurimonadaceae bacterium]